MVEIAQTQRPRFVRTQALRMLCAACGLPKTTVDRMPLVREQLNELLESREDHFEKLLRLAANNPRLSERGFALFLNRGGFYKLVKNSKQRKARAYELYRAMSAGQCATAAILPEPSTQLRAVGTIRIPA
jgi:hypothetical protein